MEWSLDGIIFSGVLVYDDSEFDMCFGLVMVFNWKGVNDLVIVKVK